MAQCLVCKWDIAHKYFLMEAAFCFFTCPWCIFLAVCSVTLSFSLTWVPEGQLKDTVRLVLGRALRKASTAWLTPRLVNTQLGDSKDVFQMLRPGFLADLWPSLSEVLPLFWIQCPILITLRLICYRCLSSGVTAALQC